MRNLQPIVRLIASLLFGITVLTLFSLIFSQMATHYFQGAAERTIRRVFTEGTQTKNGVRYDSVCRSSDTDPTRFSECDPIVVKAERSLRSASCKGGGFLRVLGKQWRCVAKFTDGATLRVDVSLGYGSRRLEIVLPFREAGTMRGAAAHRLEHAVADAW
ncbi:MAG: hypothetical protein OEM05_15505 [Myxococcales bacterium]|nr:hypothetical protein [Myxococcales bacterium]